MAKKKQETEDGKQKTNKTAEQIYEDAVEESIDEPVDEVIEGVTEKKVKYIFPNAAQCPRCKTYDTEATSTRGNKQYRRCRRAICLWRYCVTGIEEK